MKHEISFTEEYAFVRIFEAATAEGFAAMCKDLVARPEWRTGMNILSDYTDLDLSDVGEKEVRSFAQAFGPFREQYGNGHLAIVNDQPLDFGLGRMWQAFMQTYSDLEVSVFYEFDEAKQWLAENKDDV